MQFPVPPTQEHHLKLASITIRTVTVRTVTWAQIVMIMISPVH
jgi:hypothetical protein